MKPNFKVGDLVEYKLSTFSDLDIKKTVYLVLSINRGRKQTQILIVTNMTSYTNLLQNPFWIDKNKFQLVKDYEI